MNYSITDDLFVIDATGKKYGGPYKNRKSALGRIRDLKVKDDGVHGNLVKPLCEDQRQIIAPRIDAFNPAPVRQRGVYPAVSKHAYRR